VVANNRVRVHGCGRCFCRHAVPQIGRLSGFPTSPLLRTGSVRSACAGANRRTSVRASPATAAMRNPFAAFELQEREASVRGDERTSLTKRRPSIFSSRLNCANKAADSSRLKYLRDRVQHDEIERVLPQPLDVVGRNRADPWRSSRTRCPAHVPSADRQSSGRFRARANAGEDFQPQILLIA
jgi:hypothetical protein